MTGAERVEELIQNALQTAANEGALEDAEMITGWMVVTHTIDSDGEPGTGILHPAEQRLPEALALATIAVECIREDVRDWHRGRDG